MSTAVTSAVADPDAARLDPTVRPHNRVPAVNVEFWAIKLLAVTMGETAADYLAVNLGLGLTTTSLIMVAVLTLALAWQLAQKRYRPAPYWAAVVLVSVVGTLVTDNLVDNLGVSLQAAAIGFAIALAVTFAAWWASERTLSIHAVHTDGRERFYWIAILLTFALGTAVGDLVAEQFQLGYLATGLLFGAVIGLIALGWLVLRLDAVLCFWLACILTRPLGASFGDLLSQPREYGGLGLGTIVTSFAFLTVIAALVTWLAMTMRGEDFGPAPG